jgi:ornithine cyclodeaminase
MGEQARPAPRVFTEEQIRHRVDAGAALQAAGRAFTALAAGQVVQPPPLALELPEVRGETHVKGAWIRGAPIFAIKAATGFYGNPDRGLPSGSGLVLVFDATTGFPLGLLADNGYLTELRTAAAGALAARLLVAERPGRVAVIGTGVQARFQLRALAGVRRWRETAAWSPVAEHVAAYCADMDGVGGARCVTAPDPRTAVRGADLVITVTPARRPLVEAAWLSPDATVIAVGSDGPEKRELAADVLAAPTRVVADLPAQAARLGEVHHAVAGGVLALERVEPLGEIVGGRRPGRTGGGRIVCDLTGLGVQDAALAETAWTLLTGIAS